MIEYIVENGKLYIGVPNIGKIAEITEPTVEEFLEWVEEDEREGKLA